jgi:hypothetical protein
MFPWQPNTPAYVLILEITEQYSALLDMLTDAFKIPYVYDYITKLCRIQTEAILNHINPNVHGNGQGLTMHRKYKKLKVGSSEAFDHSADCSFRVIE